MRAVKCGQDKSYIYSAPRWEPNDRKRVRSSAPLGGTKGTSGALDRIRPNALAVVRFPAGGTNGRYPIGYVALPEVFRSDTVGIQLIVKNMFNVTRSVTQKTSGSPFGVRRYPIAKNNVYLKRNNSGGSCYYTTI